MRKFCIILCFFTLFCVKASLGQTIIYSCNGKYKIELPSKVELQESELNNVKRSGTAGSITISANSGKIVFQQRGLNSDQKAAYQKYCRIIIEYYKEDRNNSLYGCGDQIVVDRDLLYVVHSSVKEACRINNTPLLKFLTIQPLDINGFPVLFYSYRRKGWEGKPAVVVNVYQIFNRYESVTLTFSYREAEREKWKDIHSNIVKTFKFIRKY